MELGTRRVVHLGVTRHTTDEWTAQQLREATAFGAGPKYLIRDNDTKFGLKFQKVAEGASIKVIKTPIAAPKANSICEKFLGSVRREGLDHLLIVTERQLSRILKAYVEYFNQSQRVGKLLVSHSLKRLTSDLPKNSDERQYNPCQTLLSETTFERIHKIYSSQYGHMKDPKALRPSDEDFFKRVNTRIR